MIDANDVPVCVSLVFYGCFTSQSQPDDVALYNYNQVGNECDSRYKRAEFHVKQFVNARDSKKGNSFPLFIASHQGYVKIVEVCVCVCVCVCVRARAHARTHARVLCVRVCMRAVSFDAVGLLVGF